MWHENIQKLYVSWQNRIQFVNSDLIYVMYAYAKCQTNTFTKSIFYYFPNFFFLIISVIWMSNNFFVYEWNVVKFLENTHV